MRCVCVGGGETVFSPRLSLADPTHTCSDPRRSPARPGCGARVPRLAEPKQIAAYRPNARESRDDCAAAGLAATKNEPAAPVGGAAAMPTLAVKLCCWGSGQSCTSSGGGGGDGGAVVAATAPCTQQQQHAQAAASSRRVAAARCSPSHTQQGVLVIVRRPLSAPVMSACLHLG